jgi:hypothetical protein
VLKKIFGPKKEENGENYVKELHNLHSLSEHHIKKDETGGHVVRLGEKKNEYKFLVGNTDGKKTLEQAGVDGRINQRILEMERRCALD